MLTYHVKSQRGIAALIALIMVGMLTIIGLAALSSSDDEVKVAGNEMREARSFYAAESGLDITTASIMAQFEATGEAPAVLPSGTDSINGCLVAYETKKTGEDPKKVLSVGDLAGLYGSVESFTALSQGTDDINKSKVRILQTYEAAKVPIFQFACFYGKDMEFSPGPDMTLIGRIHTNGDLYVESDGTLKMNSFVSAAGHIYHGPKSGGAAASGDIQILNAKNKYISMKQGTDWLDSKDSWWKDSSVARWNGRVQDQAHGKQELKMNLSASDDPHKIVERATGNPDSYENKATLKIIDDKAYKYTAGAWTDVTTDMVTKGILTFSADKFYDQREAKSVDVVDVDVQKLYANGYGPSNGVMYYAGATGGAGQFPAIRLNNGATVGADLTLATPNPVYTKGNFNSVTKKNVAIMSDAFTALSGNWDDTKGALLKTLRTATSTTVNCSYLAGSGESTALNYSGGFENLMRLLEDWNTKTLTWTGAAGKLWNSVQSTGLFGSLYFNEPKRLWSYDSALDDPANLPPEAPVAKVFQRTGWTQEYCSYSGADSLLYQF